MHDRTPLRGVGATSPAIVVPPLTYAERLTHWEQALPSAGPVLLELARRFRYEQAAIARVGNELATLGRPPSGGEMLAAARADLDLGALAQPVTPRFTRAELMLPPAQAAQIDEIVAAMSNLTRVHYEWGTARAWNEAARAVVFAGPPARQKMPPRRGPTGAPLYRIDLRRSSTVHGEEEKNLRRLFDARCR